MKRCAAALVLLVTIGLTACGNAPSEQTFPNIDNADLPDVLEITVGTLGETYFSSGIKDAPDYKSVFKVCYKDTTEADYDALMEHFRTASTGEDENQSLLFDWGRLQVSSDGDSITVEAFIK